MSLDHTLPPERDVEARILELQGEDFSQACAIASVTVAEALHCACKHWCACSCHGDRWSEGSGLNFAE